MSIPTPQKSAETVLVRPRDGSRVRRPDAQRVVFQPRPRHEPHQGPRLFLRRRLRAETAAGRLRGDRRARRQGVAAARRFSQSDVLFRAPLRGLQARSDAAVPASARRKRPGSRGAVADRRVFGSTRRRPSAAAPPRCRGNFAPGAGSSRPCVRDAGSSPRHRRDAADRRARRRIASAGTRRSSTSRATARSSKRARETARRSSRGRPRPAARRTSSCTSGAATSSSTDARTSRTRRPRRNLNPVSAAPRTIHVAAAAPPRRASAEGPPRK